MPPPPLTSISAAASAPGAPLSAPAELVAFSPLGAEPKFRVAAEAVEAGDPGRAASSLEAVLAAEPALRTPTVDLWLGRLWERAKDPARALVACERAAKPAAVLAPYAELCVARSANALGRPQEALKRLETLAVPEAISAEREQLIADAAALGGDTERAIVALRTLVRATGSSNPPAESALALSEALLRSGASGADLEEALGLARRVRIASPWNRELVRRAEALEQRALAGLSPERRTALAALSSEERLGVASAWLKARERQAAEAEASALLAALGDGARFGATGCEAELVLAKARSLQRRNQAAVDGLADARVRCVADDDRAARIWFVSGRYAASAGQYADSVRYYAEVEARFPRNTLADDARLLAAQSYLELGAEDRFTELTSTLAERYPQGDMVAEGMFRLALRRMDRGSWPEAASLLERGVDWVRDGDSARGFDLAGRERYFRARALHALGRGADAKAELSALIREFPLSYYMLQAYSRLRSLDPAEAALALDAARAARDTEPFRIQRRPELDQPGFARMLELLKLGELDWALRELDALGLSRAESASEIVWGVAYVYDRAGFAQLSTELAKRRQSELSRRWPAAGWERAWQVAYPRPYAEIVEAEAKKNGLDPALVYAIMREESAFDPGAVSIANAYGLMQLILPTAKNVARRDNIVVTPQSLKRPKVNVALGCRVLAELTTRFSDNPLLAIPAYNAGPGRPVRWLKERPSAEFDLWVELIPFQETRRYIKRVLSSRAAYAFLYAGEAAESRFVLPLRAAGSAASAAL